MKTAIEIIKNKIDSLTEQIEWICEKEDVEDYQCEEYYKIQILKEVLQEMEERYGV